MVAFISGFLPSMLITLPKTKAFVFSTSIPQYLQVGSIGYGLKPGDGTHGPLLI